jgi:hypothetical protein
MEYIEKNEMKKELGKYLLDVSKLVFGGAVVSGIMREDIHIAYVLGVGIFAALGLALVGFLHIRKTKKTI